MRQYSCEKQPLCCVFIGRQWMTRASGVVWIIRRMIRHASHMSLTARLCQTERLVCMDIVLR